MSATLDHTKEQPTTSAFGQLPVSFATRLYKARRSSELVFALYISARRGIKAWTFNEADIRHNTGLHHTLVAQYSKQYIAAGIFVEAGRTSKRSFRYTLDHAKFEAYLNCPYESSPADAPSSESAFSDVSPSDDRAHHAVTGKMSPRDVLARHPVTTDKEDNKEEREKRTDKQADVRSSSLNIASLRSAPINDLRDNDTSTLNARKFLEEVKALQADSPEFEIVFSSRADKAAVEFFRQNSKVDSDTLIETYSSILFEGFGYKCLDLQRATPEQHVLYHNAVNSRNSKDFNPLWWQQRSSDVAWFLNNYRNVLSRSYTSQLLSN